MVSIADRNPFSFRIDEIVDPPDGTVLPNDRAFSASLSTADAGTTHMSLAAPAFAGQFAIFSVTTLLTGTRQLNFEAAFDDLGHNAIEFSGGYGVAVFFSTPLRWIIFKQDACTLVTVT